MFSLHDLSCSISTHRSKIENLNKEGNMTIQKEIEYLAPLSQGIAADFAKLRSKLPPKELRLKRGIESSTGLICIADLIAYQIGWGTFLIRWYEEGIQGLKPHMPGDGFLSWDYNAIAESFYKRYGYDGGDEQMAKLSEITERVLEIVEIEYQNGNLDKKGAWDWCTLSSGTKWPLSKWISVNVHAPCKRTMTLMQKFLKK